MLNLNDQIEITIEKMANEGKGLGRFNNQIIFVPYSAPGDRLKVTITKLAKNFAEANIIEIINPSANRITAPCPYYGECGGCNFQHLDYPSQLEQKTFLVKEALENFLKQKDLPFKNSIPSPKIFNYRNRIQIHNKNNQIGFYKRKTHEVLPIKNCMIAEDPLNEHLSKMVPSELAPMDKLELYLDTSLQVQQRFIDNKKNTSFFSQVNRFQNSNLVAVVVDLSNKNQNFSSIVDLYAGAGNFSFPLSEAHPNKKVFAVELSTDLINEGRRLQSKTAKPRLEKLHFVQSPVELFVQNFKLDSNDFVLLDPPRTGCSPEVIYLLGAAKRNQILYISCNYLTLGRDLALLKNTAQNWGLSLSVDFFQCFDMFPQTDHIEVMASLSIS